MSEAASIHVEHHALQAHLDAIDHVADVVGEIGTEETRARVENVYEFLTRHVRPHMQAEDQVLYPLIDSLIGTPNATAALRRDHAELGVLIDDLVRQRHTLQTGELDPALVHGLRRTLYALHVLLRLHFAKENELYFPFLDERLDATGADDLARRMQEVTLRAS